MDIILLGLLMLKGSTLYELRKIISEQLTFATSGSTGSIQGAIKKLLTNDHIIFEEQVEKSVNKKIYYITEAGKSYFLQQVAKPMVNKTTNMELGKLFFMGYTPAGEREAVIDTYITELEQELAILKDLAAMREEYFKQMPLKEVMAANMEILKDLGGAKEFMSVEAMEQVDFFHQATLDYGISQLQHDLEWFKRLKLKMKDAFQ